MNIFRSLKTPDIENTSNQIPLLETQNLGTVTETQEEYDFFRIPPGKAFKKIFFHN